MTVIKLFVCFQSTSYEHIYLKEPVIKPASSQPILPLSSPVSPPVHQEDKELESMRHKLHELGSYRDQERISNESIMHELEKEKKLTAQLKV